MIEFGRKSMTYSKLIRSKAKMIEFDVPEESHIQISEDVIKSFLGALAIVADISRKYVENFIRNDIWDLHLKDQLHKSAEYFDALISSELGNSDEYQDYIAILAATAYYLGDYNGSSRVMLNYISNNLKLVNDSEDIVRVFKGILTGEVFLNDITITGKYSEELNTLVDTYKNYILLGVECNKEIFVNLQEKVYRTGDDFSTIIVNCLLALTCKKIDTSSTKLLPEFSRLDFSIWKSYIQSKESIKELWPSQIELGTQGFFSGKSGIVQMPTSSGKTASINLILRAAFYSNRINNAIIIAPFRALCREICRNIQSHFINDKNVVISEIFDLPEIPEEFFAFDAIKKRVFIVTPEKLLFLLRNHQSFIGEIGLCIFDEAHLFDDLERGTDFELLLSAVKLMSSITMQKILISAVVPNSEAINQWFNEEGVVISNNVIKTTEKRVAFRSLNSRNEQLKFIDSITFKEEFFVPRTVEIRRLESFSKERKKRIFPESNANDISIYYAIKLVKNGGIAIFCGRRDTVNVILRRFIELDKRRYNLSDFMRFSDELEVKKLGNLIEKNLGKDSIEYNCSKLGIFSHHSGLPMGLRVAIEYSFSKNKINNVVCTSTLAQGVNLPIRYLLVPSLYQAGKLLKVRDFQNLIGRVGRAGKYTEGTIILTDSEMYEKKQYYKKLLNPINSEDCKSNIFAIIGFEFVKSTDRKEPRLEFDFWSLIREKFCNYKNYRMKIQEFLSESKNRNYINDFDSKINQIDRTLVAIENYIASMYEVGIELNNLVENTFGYFLGDEEGQQKIKELFILVGNKIITSTVRVEVIARNSIGLFRSEFLQTWVQANIDSLQICKTEKELLNVLICIIRKLSNYKKMEKLSEDDLLYIFQLWIDGIPYYQILERCSDKSISIEKRGELKPIELFDIIAICNSGLGHEATIILNAVNNNFEELVGNKSSLLNILMKRLKYGLLLEKEINIYELGFSDRVVAQCVGQEINSIDKNKIRNEIKCKSIELKSKLNNFPSYFMKIIEDI